MAQVGLPTSACFSQHFFRETDGFRRSVPKKVPTEGPGFGGFFQERTRLSEGSNTVAGEFVLRVVPNLSFCLRNLKSM